jgi:TolB-like protein
MSQVFISYSHSTEAQSRRVEDGLRALGHEVWRDDALPAHRSYSEVIEERLKAAHAVVVLWSEEAAHSQWVRAEAEVARQAGTLVQASLDGVIPPLPFSQIQCADLKGWRGARDAPGWRKLIDSVTALASGEARSPAPAESPPAMRRRPWALGALAAALVVAVAAGSWFLFSRSGPSDASSSEGRIAVLPFDATASGADAQRFAAGLSDEILSVLSANQAQVVSRTESAALRSPDAAAIKRLGAALLLDGTVEETDGRIKVRVHLDDTATRTILWSEDFERPAAEAEPLQAEVAAKATTMAAYAQRAKAAGLSNAVVGDYITGVEHIRFDWTGGMQAAEPILRRVIAEAPRFPGGHAFLAASLGLQSLFPGAPRAAEQRAEAIREAQAALALDPSSADAPYGVLAVLRPLTDWQGRFDVLRRGMAANPNNPDVNYLVATELAQVGQLKTAAVTARRGVALDPLWPGANWTMAWRLLESGHESEGLETFDRMARLWPKHQATRRGRLLAMTLYGDRERALALLGDAGSLPDGMDARGVALFRSYLEAVAAGHGAERARAAAELSAGVRAGAFDPGVGMAMLARLDDLDGAFAAADRYVAHAADRAFDEPAYLFMPATAPLRRDPRFMPLAARLGLPQYWLASSEWPDFCAEPGLPYDCKAEAAKVVGTAKR